MINALTTAALQFFIDKNATDLYLTVGASPCIRVHSKLEYHTSPPLCEEDIRTIMQDLLPEKAIAEFERDLEYNTAIRWDGNKRLRINVFRQKQNTGMVIRRVQMEIPTFEDLSLPAIYGNIVMEKHGLILIVGQTDSGKSSSLAAMVGHRNQYGSGHIITIEDPIEFEHNHKNCIITQRDIGIDTLSYSTGLKNALRQMPDVIVIGEIRDLETLHNAISFAETGHLCLATLHALNASQAIERIISLYPDEKRSQVLTNLSLTLKAILSQRLVPNVQNTRSIAIEIMLNLGHIRELILEGNTKALREYIEKGNSSGMQTFEQALLKMYFDKVITEEVALAEADSPANLRLAMRQTSIEKQVADVRPIVQPMNKLQF